VRPAHAFRLLRTVLLAALLVACAPVERLFASDAEPWPRWQTNDATSTIEVDHRAWDRFLARYLQRDAAGINLMEYAAVTGEDRAALKAYLGVLAATSVSRLNRTEQFAFWVNLYNALTVSTVLEHYPVKSIRDIDISPGLFSVGPWGAKMIHVEDMPLSLDDIEHRILRPLWRDPRTHYALNCASLGCPNLQAHAYRAQTLDADLDAAARAYVNSPRGARFEGGHLLVSRLYQWYVADFGGNDVGIITHLTRYAQPDLARQLATFHAIEDGGYDWSLNAAR
jgi:hypothetical protein